jgi:membrane protein YdbS with pleckstrin-like domain
LFCAGQEWILARRGPVPEEKEVLSQSAVAGILVAVILIVTVVAVTIYFIVRNRYSLLSEIFILFAAGRFTATCIVTAAVLYVHCNYCSTICAL